MLFPQLFCVVFLLQDSIPVPEDLIYPQVNLITGILEHHRFPLFHYHIRLLFYVAGIISQAWLNQSVSVLRVQGIELLLFLQSLLKLLVVVLHIEIGMSLVKVLNLQQSLIAFGIIFCEKFDGLMVGSQSRYSLLVRNANLLWLDLDFHLLSLDIELVKLLQFFDPSFFALLFFALLLVLEVLSPSLFFFDGLLLLCDFVVGFGGLQYFLQFIHMSIIIDYSIAEI